MISLGLRNPLILVGLVLIISCGVSRGHKCGVQSFDAPVPSPTDHTGPGVLYKHFEVDATFKSAPPYECSCCEYQQRIKGAAFVDGNKIEVKLRTPDPNAVGPFPPGGHPTVEIPLDENTYHEDYRDYGDGHGANRYGHRDETTTADEEYTKGGSGPDAATPDRATGCHYHMTDEPGFRGCQPGHTYKIDFTFEMKIVKAVACELCDGCQTKELAVRLEKTEPAGGSSSSGGSSSGGSSGGGGIFGAGPTVYCLFIVFATTWTLWPWFSRRRVR